MLSLLKICIFSLVVSFGVFANTDEATILATDSEELTLDQNSDQFLGIIKDAVSKATSFIKDIGNKALGKILNIVGMGSCSETKKQLEANGIKDKKDQKNTLEGMLEKVDGEKACGEKASCDAVKDIIKECY